MKQENAAIRRIAGLFLVLVSSTLISVGCASLPPEQFAKDVATVSGKWEGTLYVASGGTFDAILTIAPNATFEVMVPRMGPPGPRFTGTLSIENGKYRYKSDTTNRTGTYTLHEGNGERILIGSADDGNVSSRYRPAK